MEDGDSDQSRRRFLHVTGTASLLGFAGCLSAGEGGHGGGEHAEREEDWCLEALDEEVPEEERTARSVDGGRRNPDNVLPKEEVGYKCSLQKTGHPMGEQLCSNCTFFIPDKDGDGIGACTQVAGQIRSQHWCEIWAPREGLNEQQE